MINKHINAYAHDFRGMVMKEVHLKLMLTGFTNEIQKDLLAIADSGEFEDMRREVIDYFNVNN